MTDLEVFRTSEGLDTQALTYLIMSFVLIMTRFLAFLKASPFFGRSALSRTVSTGTVIALSILCVPSIFQEFQANPILVDYFLPLVFKELVIGFFLGIIVWMPVRGLEFSSVLLDTQRAASQGADMDVVFGGQTTVTAHFLSQMFSGFFFASGGFLMVQMVMFESTKIWPPTTALPPLADQAAYVFIKLAGALIFTALIFALPISGFMVLADIAIAFVAKSAPTINALTFGMPVKSAILIIMLFFYMDLAYPKLLDSFAGSLDMMERLFGDE